MCYSLFRHYNNNTGCKGTKERKGIHLTVLDYVSYFYKFVLLQRFLVVYVHEPNRRAAAFIEVTTFCYQDRRTCVSYILFSTIWGNTHEHVPSILML